MRIPIASKKPNFESSNDAVREQTHPNHLEAPIDPGYFPILTYWTLLGHKTVAAQQLGFREHP
jgi:hypothetical protein